MLPKTLVNDPLVTMVAEAILNSNDPPLRLWSARPEFAAKTLAYTAVDALRAAGKLVG